MVKTFHIGKVKIRGIVLAWGISATIHGGLFCALYFLEWTPSAVSTPQVDFAKGEQPTWVKVTLLPPPDDEAEQLPAAPDEAETTEESPDEIPPPTSALASQVVIDATPLEHTDDSVRTRKVSDPTPGENQETAIPDQDVSPATEQVEAVPPLEPMEVAEPDVQPAELNVPSPTEPVPVEIVDVPVTQPVTPLTSPRPSPLDGAPPVPATAGVETGVDVLDLPRPGYPIMSRRLGEEGVVLLRVEVLADGSVGTIKVLRDPGFRRLTTAAVAAAKKGRFKPASRDGRPIRSTVRIPFRFVLR